MDKRRPCQQNMYYEPNLCNDDSNIIDRKDGTLYKNINGS